MKIYQLVLGLFLVLNFESHAQIQDREVLFTIDEKPYYVDEFIRVYKKGLQFEKNTSKKELDSYLDLFITYKLKVEKAKQLGLQNKGDYYYELNVNRQELFQNYLYDIPVVKKLVQEAYDRLQKQINSAHILVSVDIYANPEDTLKAYRKIEAIRDKSLKGENFTDLAHHYSDDLATKEQGGNLGYHTVFGIEYPLENVMYHTDKGSISKPVRTKYGYHIIKVEDIRPNLGAVTVAHIMISNGKHSLGEAKKKIDSIYQEINKGVDFFYLASILSEDAGPTFRKGVLKPFSLGQLKSETFENVAFSIQKLNDISKPFETEFGWHIVKLLDKSPVKSFPEMHEELQMEVGKDIYRVGIIEDFFANEMRKKYVVKKSQKAYNHLVKVLTGEDFRDKKRMDFLRMNTPVLFYIDKDVVRTGDFIDFIRKDVRINEFKKNKKINQRFIDLLYQKFENKKLSEYYSHSLEKENVEFGMALEEYSDKLLVFNLMNKEIFEYLTNSENIEEYYSKNKQKYEWQNDRFGGTVVYTNSENAAKKIKKQLKKNQPISTSEATIENGIFDITQFTSPKNNNKEGSLKVIQKDTGYYVVKINKILPAGPKSSKEYIGQLKVDFQNHLEENWVKQLKQEFKVHLNSTALEHVKKQIQ